MPKLIVCVLTAMFVLPATAFSCGLPDKDWSAMPLFSAPATGPIVQKFGLVTHPLLMITKMHIGVDYADAQGDLIVAAAPGVVSEAGWRGAYGNFVRIDHGNGVATAYAHLARIDVVPGACLAAGDRIGLTGNTGLSSGPHLHFEVLRDGKPVDPEPLLMPSRH